MYRVLVILLDSVINIVCHHVNPASTEAGKKKEIDDLTSLVFCGKYSEYVKKILINVYFLSKKVCFCVRPTWA